MRLLKRPNRNIIRIDTNMTLSALRSLGHYTVSSEFEHDLTCEERKALITAEKTNVDVLNPFES